MYYTMYYAIVTCSIAYEILDGYASSHFYPRTLTIHPLLYYFILLLHLSFGLLQSTSFCSRRAVSQLNVEIIKIPNHTKKGQRRFGYRKRSQEKDLPETAFALCCALLCQVVRWGLAVGHLVLFLELA